MSCEAVAGWTEEQNKKLNHPIRVGVLGGSSYPYMSALFGIMSNGNVVVPLDVQLNMNSLSEYINHVDLDYLFYEWEYFERVEGAKELCPNLQGTVCLQNRKHEYCIQKIWKENQQYKLEKEINPKDCAMLLYTSGTTGQGKGVLLSHENLIDNVFCTEDDGHPEDEVYMNVLPVHHIFCLNGDFLLGLRYGNVLCLNQDMTKLASHIQLFQPTVIRMVPMMAKTLYNRIAVLREQYREKSIDEIKGMVLGKRLHKIVSGGGYLAPERYIPFEKTSSKKIIRGKYFEQKAKQKEAIAKLKMPENDTQQMIYNAVAESLGHQKFGVDTDFYEAGLDSLGSVLLLSNLYDRMQISIFKLDKSVDLEKLKAAVEQVFEIHPELKDIIQPHEGVLKNFRDDKRRFNQNVLIYGNF